MKVNGNRVYYTLLARCECGKPAIWERYEAGKGFAGEKTYLCDECKETLEDAETSGK